MKFTKFSFKNFRGIANASLGLNPSGKEDVGLLVGLNESGKTTILEAIHHFRSNPDLKKRDPNLSTRNDSDYQRMLPIQQRALFTGTIEICATVLLDDADKAQLENFLKERFKLREVAFPTSFVIEHLVDFDRSKHVKTRNQWTAKFQGKKSGKGIKAFTQLTGEDWQIAVKFIQPKLPHIVYFPAVLFDLPGRIVLEDSKSAGAPAKNAFYSDVLNDILRAIDPRLDLATDLIARIKSREPSDQQNLDALIVKIEKNLQATVLTRWKEIFENNLSDKTFRVRAAQLPQTGQAYLEIQIQDGDGIFSINERSAGFRWFFAFIVLTEYRLMRGDRVLFLFDEPAANLHPNAQQRLVRAFNDLTSKGQVLYSTHSHYLINPKWLGTTQVVRNDQMLDKSFTIDVGGASASISITPYKKFAGSHPDQTFFYRPILDHLKYAAGPLELTDNCVILEGKTDFYLLLYLRSCLPADARQVLNLFPGGGASEADALISLLIGWGYSFSVLVDSDVEGEKQKARYLAKFESLGVGKIYGIADVDTAWNGKSIEAILAPEDVEKIMALAFPSEKRRTKKLLHQAIQILQASHSFIEMEKQTRVALQNIYAFLDATIVKQHGGT
jgi:predicted ATP-dependent endonuclease of OLD family